jgi:adenylate cyclase
MREQWLTFVCGDIMAATAWPAGLARGAARVDINPRAAPAARIRPRADRGPGGSGEVPAMSDTTLTLAAGPVPPSPSTIWPSSDCACNIQDWLQHEARYCPTMRELILQLSHRMLGEGLPMHRVGVLTRTLHPRVLAAGYVWRADNPDEVSTYERDHQTQQTKAYQESPIRLILEGAPGIRRRLADADCPRDFPILEDLDADGVTDYLCLPLPLADGQRFAIAYATRQPGGFHDEELRRLGGITAALALVAEVLSVRRIAINLMDTYLGHKTGQRVLQGAIARGANETIDSVVWYSDLRGFTAMTDRLPPETLLQLLNDHYEHIVEPIHEHGGEVLKFIGDAALAIFPLDGFADAQAASRAALDAAAAAAAQTAAHNAARLAENLPEIRYGVALHRGAVSYGNIGGLDRLDFTVIGRTVNHAARIAGQCRPLDRDLLISAAFAADAPMPLQSLGFHALRGVREPQEIFSLPDRPT